jgi:hypothetical protein
MNIEAAAYCEMLVTVYQTTLKKAEPSFSKMLASTVKTQPTATFPNAALRRCSRCHSIERDILTFHKSEISTFAVAQTANLPLLIWVRRTPIIYPHYLSVWRRLYFSIRKIIAEDTNRDVPPCVMTLPSPIISANKIVISKEYFIIQKLIGFLEHRMKYQTCS